MTVGEAWRAALAVIANALASSLRAKRGNPEAANTGLTAPLWIATALRASQ